MNIILVAGGSGGHIYPCLELAKYLDKMGENVLLIGSVNSMEKEIYENSNLNYKLLNIGKEKIKGLFLNYDEIEKIYTEYNPQCVILFGNYISFSFALMAFKKKIPIYLHEQNVIYGQANKFIGVFAKRIYTSLPIEKKIYKKKCLLVGNPQGDVVVYEDVKLDKNRKNIFIVMGSLGSKTVNDVLVKLIDIANSKFNYHIITGKKHYHEFLSKINKKDNIFIYPYINPLISYLKDADLVVSRSGATTLLEIINYTIPSILIPSPYVKNNHQYKNAKYLFDNKGCYILEEKYMTAFKLRQMIDRILDNENDLEKMRIQLKSMVCSNSREKIYKDILKNEKISK